VAMHLGDIIDDAFMILSGEEDAELSLGCSWKRWDLGIWLAL
jgi:hypothetical protein